MFVVFVIYSTARYTKKYFFYFHHVSDLALRLALALTQSSVSLSSRLNLNNYLTLNITDCHGQDFGDMVNVSFDNYLRSSSEI